MVILSIDFEQFQKMYRKKYELWCSQWQKCYDEKDYHNCTILTGKEMGIFDFYTDIITMADLKFIEEGEEKNDERRRLQEDD